MNIITEKLNELANRNTFVEVVVKTNDGTRYSKKGILQNYKTEKSDFKVNGCNQTQLLFLRHELKSISILVEIFNNG